MTDNDPLLGHPACDAAAAAIVTVGEERYMRDARGALVPLDLVRPQDQLMDEVVRRVVHYAEELSAQIGRYRAHTMDDLGAFDALLEAEYGGHARKSAKGNRTYLSFDGCLKVQVQVSETIAFGPELQTARGLVEECVEEWAEGTRDEVRALITHAFSPKKHGEISRTAIYALLRLDIEDTRWRKAMEAVRDAMRVIGSKSYVRIYRRAAADASWEPVTLDLAKAAS